MLRFLFIFFQFLIFLIIASWAINNSKQVSIEFKDITVTTSTSVIIIGLISIIALSLILQRFIFFIKQSKQRFMFYREKSVYQKGHNSFILGMAALFNRDFKKAILEAQKTNKYLKDKSLGLLLTSETLKIEKKYNELNDVYEEMLKNPNMNLLGLRGLMEQNLRSQDYHHALIYGEKLFNLNPNIDQLYKTLVNIIGKTNNWHKLIFFSDESFKHKIIDKKTYSENKSIAFFEIAKIKHKSFEDESIDLMEKALKLRQNFSPYINFYIKLLINNNKLSKAKKILKKEWANFPHPDLKKQITNLSKALNISYLELVKYITSNNVNNYETQILFAESYIKKENWIEARNQIKSLLEHKPTKEVCLLMAKIEEGESGNPQKINAWVSRSNLGKLNKIWICQISGTQQEQWSPISLSGYFNSLEWKYPKNSSELSASSFEINKINYIDSE